MTVVLGNKVAFYENLVQTQKEQKLHLSEELEQTKASLYIENSRVQELDRQHKELCQAVRVLSQQNESFKSFAAKVGFS